MGMGASGFEPELFSTVNTWEKKEKLFLQIVWNFRNWSFFSLVFPTDKEKLITNPALAQWEKNDQFLLSWINTTLAENMSATVYGLTTACHEWVYLPTDLHLNLAQVLITLCDNSNLCSKAQQLAQNIFSQQKPWLIS